MKYAHIILVSVFALSCFKLLAADPTNLDLSHSGLLGNKDGMNCKNGVCTLAPGALLPRSAGHPTITIKNPLPAEVKPETKEGVFEFDDEVSINRQMSRSPKEKLILREVGFVGCPACGQFKKHVEAIAKNYNAYFGSIIQMTPSSTVGLGVAMDVNAATHPNVTQLPNPTYPAFQILKWDDQKQDWVVIKSFQGYSPPIFASTVTKDLLPANSVTNLATGTAPDVRQAQSR